MRLGRAMALCGVDTGDPQRYDAALCQLEPLRRVLDRTTVTGSDELDDAVSELTVTLDDGVVCRSRGDVSTPDPDRERQGRRLAEKFDTLVTPLAGITNTRELRAMLEDLHQQRDIRALMALTRT